MEPDSSQSAHNLGMWLVLKLRAELLGFQVPAWYRDASGFTNINWLASRLNVSPVMTKCLLSVG